VGRGAEAGSCPSNLAALKPAGLLSTRSKPVQTAPRMRPLRSCCAPPLCTWTCCTTALATAHTRSPLRTPSERAEAADQCWTSGRARGCWRCWRRGAGTRSLCIVLLQGVQVFATRGVQTLSLLACTPALCAATTGLLHRPPSRREFSRVRRLAPWRSSPGAWWLPRAAQRCGTSPSWPSGRTSSAVRPSACGHSLRCTLPALKLGCWNLEGRVPGSPSGAAPTAGVYAGMHLGGSRAAVVVTEIFDSELLGEGALPTMRHATAHLLEARSAGLWVSISQAGCTLHASRTAVTAASVCLYSGTGVGCAVLRELQRADSWAPCEDMQTGFGAMPKARPGGGWSYSR